MRPRTVLCLVLLLLAPSAAARAPVHGDVTFASSALLRGDVVLRDGDGGLDLGEAARRGEPLTLTWARATGVLVAKPWSSVAAPGSEPLVVSSTHRNEPVSWGEGSLVRVACGGDACKALVLGPVGMRGAVDGPLRWLDERASYWGGSEGIPEGFARVFPAGAFAASAREDEGATRLRDAAAFADGALVLFLKDATLDVAHAGGGRETLDARERRAPVAGAPGVAAAEDVEERFLVLRLEGASLAAPAGGSARLLAERPALALDGALWALDASGRVGHAGASRAFTATSILVEGRLDVAPAVDAASLLAPPVLRASLSGEADRVRVGGAAVGGLGGAARDAAPAVTGVVALLAVAWLTRALLVPLYSRIAPGRALHNPNRARVYGLACAEPGITAAEVGRRVGLSRMVVRYHLQLLESHGLLVRRVDGRKQRYFPAAAMPVDVGVSARLLREPEGRRRVFDVLAESPGALTQRELAERTGLSQRLVSYHLQRMEAAGSLVVDGTMPRRYALRAEWLSRDRSAAS